MSSLVVRALGSSGQGRGPESAGVQTCMQAALHRGLGKAAGQMTVKPRGAKGRARCWRNLWWAWQEHGEEGHGWAELCRLPAKAVGSTVERTRWVVPRVAVDQTLHLSEPDFSCGAPRPPGIVAKLK